MTVNVRDGADVIFTSGDSTSFGSIVDIVESATSNAQLPEEPVELTPEEKAKHDRWLKRREEQELRAQKRAEELAAIKEKRRQAAAAASKARIESVSPQPTRARAATPRDERAAEREDVYNTWVEFVNKLNHNEPTCCPDDQISIPLDTTRRSHPRYSGARRSSRTK